MMYCNSTTNNGAVSQQIDNTYIVIPKDEFTNTIISLYNTSIVILHYILVIKFHKNIIKSSKFKKCNYINASNEVKDTSIISSVSSY